MVKSGLWNKIDIHSYDDGNTYTDYKICLGGHSVTLQLKCFSPDHGAKTQLDTYKHYAGSSIEDRKVDLFIVTKVGRYDLEHVNFEE